MKKKNPQDATLRNIRALKKRVKALEVTVAVLVASAVVDAKKRRSK